MSHPFFAVPTPMILGHRGAAGHVPENTLESFARALELGAHTIETDVQVTRDGVPVLMHDEALDRVTNGSGPVAARSLEEVRALDAGHRFTIDDRGAVSPEAPASFRGRGLRVPSLEEAFERFPEARFNLEIKTGEQGVVASVVSLVSKFGREDRTLVTAADDAIMGVLRAELARTGVAAATSACVSEVVAVVRSAVAGSAPPAQVMALQIPTTFGKDALVTPTLVEHAHAHGIAVHVWTINEPSEMASLLDEGVDGLVTDFPDRAVAVAAERAT